jgi:hypothetical protein
MNAFAQLWNRRRPNMSTVAIFISAVSAIFAAISVGLSYVSSQTYVQSLMKERIDRCVSAAYAFKGAVNRAIGNKHSQQFLDRKISDADIWSQYTDAWTSWREFNQAFRVLWRYRRDLDEKLPDALAATVTKLKTPFHEGWHSEKEAEKFNEEIQVDFKRLIGGFEDRVVEPAPSKLFLFLKKFVG